MSTVNNALRVRGLSVSFRLDGGPVEAVRHVDLDVPRGQLVALLGESGSGKSVTARAVMGLAGHGSTVTADELMLGDTDLRTVSGNRLRELRGTRMSLVLQDALSALNPVLTIGDQIAEAITAHRPVRIAQAREGAAELLAQVGLDPARIRDYPHQLSGGMRQRVVIAIALANDPAVVIADEPTSGLDVLVQAGVLDLLDDLRRRWGLALLVVSHDLPVIERIADRIAVMRGGQLVEIGPREEIIAAPQHPYTQHLLATAARLQLPASRVTGAEAGTP
ncbi:MAG: ABC transporter ATP-binding protein [Actinomycetes bacterium]